MAKDNKISLSWDDFVKLGNPENAPDLPEDNEPTTPRSTMQVRLHYERKGRGGKEAVIIRGIDEDDDSLNKICKELKTKIGVGGSTKEGEIIMQGSQRDKMMTILRSLGFTNAKNSGG